MKTIILIFSILLLTGCSKSEMVSLEKYNMLGNGKKLLLTLVLLFTSNILYAGQIKLSCDINLTKTYSTGREDIKKYHEIYEIDESTDRTNIMSVFNTELSPSVSTYRTADSLIQVSINNSDQNKWDITNKFTMKGNSHIVSVIIDRNSGQIFTSHEMIKKDNDRVIFSGIGSCEKIDTTKKKF